MSRYRSSSSSSSSSNRNTILHYIRIKKHIWITIFGMIIVIHIYYQILRSTLITGIPSSMDDTHQQQQLESIQKYNPIVKVQQQQQQQKNKLQNKLQDKKQVRTSSTSTMQASTSGSSSIPTATTSTAATTTINNNNIKRDENVIKNPKYYMVFSTSCSLQQNWESYVFFYHCRRVRQPGNIIRIVSGCTEIEIHELTKFHNQYIKTMAITSIPQSFHIHFTPSYSSLYLSEGKYPYKYMNKPYGLRHWMENSLHLGWTMNKKTITSPYYNKIDDPTEQQQQHQELLDSIVILMDPDMILLQPMTHDFTNSNNILWVKEPTIKKVTHGNPISQQDGYLGNEWMKFNFTYITGGNTTIKSPPESDGPIYWNTGPPYLATVYDMYHIVSLWTETAPRVLQVFPQLFAEMYGFVIATVMLQLPFQMIKSIVVSTTTATNREGWSYIDAINDNDICHVPILATSLSVDGSMIESSSTAQPKLPIGLHYCGVYLLGKSMFSKYRVKKNILNCDKALMMIPPSNIYPQYNYKIYPRRADLSDAQTYKEVQKGISSTTAKREAFMICGLTSALNEALRFYKQKACGKDGLPLANYNETYTIHNDPTDY